MRALMRPLALLLCLFLAQPAAAVSGHPFSCAPVSDTALSGMRGGFQLPGGLAVALRVASATMLNGTVILRTEFAVDKGPASLDVSDGSGHLDVRVGGGSIASGDGMVAAQQDGIGSKVTFSAPGLDVSHLAGDAYGSIIANARNGVAIDNATTVTINLANATAFNLGSTMLRVDALGIDAATRLAH